MNNPERAKAEALEDWMTEENERLYEETAAQREARRLCGKSHADPA